MIHSEMHKNKLTKEEVHKVKGQVSKIQIGRLNTLTTRQKMVKNIIIRKEGTQEIFLMSFSKNKKKNSKNIRKQEEKMPKIMENNQEILLISEVLLLKKREDSTLIIKNKVLLDKIPTLNLRFKSSWIVKEEIQ
jgi:hypothetical protein